MTGARKHTIAGAIPAEWDAKLIKNCCDVVRGASPRPAGDPRYFDGDYLPWITVADVTGMPGMYLDGTRTKLTKEGAAFTRLIPPATLIITNSGATLGVPKITRELSGANDGIAVFLNLKDVSKECLFYFLESKTEYFRNELAPGVGQPNLNTELLGDVAIPIPPPGEQDRIVGALSTWDTAIQKIEQLIAAKERHYSHELSRMFSEGRTTPRKCRLGDISYVPQKLPEAPKADDVYVLVRLYCKGIERNERQKKAPTKNGRPILRRNAGELLVGRQNVHNGGFGIVPQGLDGALASNAITSLRFHPDKACTEYVFFFLSRPSYYNKLERVMGGTGQKEISESQLLAISIPLPDIRAQTAIARYLNALGDEINLLGQSVAALKTQKRGLMQKLLTGQWRLPVKERATTA